MSAVSGIIADSWLVAALMAVGQLGRYVMTRAFLICCVVALTGCVHALHPQNARSERTLRIQASTAERHAVRANEGQDYRVTG
jgi:hypothetical protein